MEIIDVFQDSDCPHVVVWTKIGHVLHSWAAHPLRADGFPVCVYEYRGNNPATDVPFGMPVGYSLEDLTAIVDAAEKYLAPVPANG
jgi:hypothetical protein